MDRKGISQRHYMFKEGVDTSPIKVLRPSGFLSDVSEQTKRKPIFGRSSSSTNVTSNYFPGNWCGSICE